MVGHGLPQIHFPPLVKIQRDLIFYIQAHGQLLIVELVMVGIIQPHNQLSVLLERRIHHGQPQMEIMPIGKPGLIIADILLFIKFNM